MAEGSRKILNISLPIELFMEIEGMAAKEAKTKGEFAREALRQYVANKKRWEQIRKWGAETTARLNIDNEKDVDRIVHELREDRG